MEKNFKLDEIEKITANLVSKIMKNKSGTATVVALSGELGAGKTNLTQEVGKQFGITEKIISPTFVIMKKYKIAGNKFKHLIHIDAYRMEQSLELEHLNWKEFISDPENLILIEWPEKVAEIIPKNAIHVFLSHIDEETRGIKM